MYQVTIQIGGTVIRPGDFVFGDVGGVVVVTKDLTSEFPAVTEYVYERECGVR